MDQTLYPTPLIRAALQELDPALGSLRAASQLRKRLSPAHARLALELHQLRQRAGGKLGDAGKLWLTKKGYEQATGMVVADYRAARIASWERAFETPPWIVDGTAGIGGDSMALLRAGVRRLASNEADELSSCLLRSNLLEIRGEAHVLRSRIESRSLGGDAILLDPDRRSPKSGAQGASGPRQGNPELWSPSWDICHQLMLAYPNACLKLAPGVDPLRLQVPTDRARAWQWISLAGELKETTLWTGPWATEAGVEPGFQLGSGAQQRNVTLLARDGSLRAHWCAEPLQREALGAGAAREVAWIAEPDPALIRAGLVGALAAEFELWPLAEDCVYLGGAQPAESELLTNYRVLEHCPLDPKRVRAMLGGHGIGPLTVKKRGHKATSLELAKRLGQRDGQHGLLIVARLGASHHAYLVTQLSLTK